MTTSKKAKKVEKAETAPMWEPSDESVLYRAYHQRQPGGMWFSPGNMKAFGTVISDVWFCPTTTHYLFITREVRRSMSSRSTSHYTLRMMNAAGNITNIGELFSTYSKCSRTLTSLTKGDTK